MKKVRKLFPIFQVMSCNRCGCSIVFEKCYKVEGYQIGNQRLPGGTYCKQCATSKNLAIELIEEFYTKNEWMGF